MFGFSKKKTIMNAVKNVCENNAPIYENAVREVVAAGDSIADDELDRMMGKARKTYLDACCESMVKSFEASSPNIALKVKMALMDPSIVGFDGYDISNGVGAGVLYSVCLNSMTGNKYSPGDIAREAVELNHYQNDVMNIVLHNLDEEYSSGH